jgi:hypothetical protein
MSKKSRVFTRLSARRLARNDFLEVKYFKILIKRISLLPIMHNRFLHSHSTW